MFKILLYIFSLLFYIEANVIEIKPKDGYAVLAKESKYNITCTTSERNVNPKELKWIDNFEKVVVYNHIANLSTVYYEVEGGVSRLMFQKVMHEDNGTYVCLHKDHNTSFDIFYYEPIIFSSAKQQYLELKSEKSWISCIKLGYPFAETKWYFNGKLLIQGLKYFMRADGLYVRNVRMSDAGVYTCEGTIPGVYNHTRSQHIKVTVEEPPRIVKSAVSLSEQEGTDLEITFEVHGTCPCKYHFSLNHKDIEASDRISFNAGSLTFSPLLRSDHGVVTCRVSNNVGNDSSITDLTVIVRPKVLSFEGVRCEVGGACEMSCKVEGEKGMVVNITNTVSSEQIQSIVKDTDTHILKFDDVSPPKAGLYTCTAISEIGRHSLTASLVVEYKPKSLSSTEMTLYTWKGQSRNLSCQVDAVPPPTFTWISRSKDVATDVENTDVFTLYDTIKTAPHTYLSVLQLYMHEKKLKYYFNTIKCIASNNIGNLTVNFDVKRAFVPNVAVYKGNKTYPQEIWLKLTPPVFDGYVSLKGYHVVVKLNKHIIAQYNFTLDENIRIRNLAPNTTYEIRYHAFNRVGLGIVDGLTIKTTPPCKPYPTTITSPNISTTLTSYLLQWDDPIQVGANFTNIHVIYRKVDSSTDLMVPLHDWIPLPTNNNDTSLKLVHLEGMSTYQVAISSDNEFGRSHDHEPFYFQTTPISVQHVLPKTEESTMEGTKRIPDSEGSKGAATTHDKDNNKSNRVLVLLLVLLVLVVFFILVDGSCYYLKSRSLTATLCTHLRGGRKQLFNKDDVSKSSHSNSKHLLQPEVESANNNINNNNLNNINKQSTEDATLNNYLITTSSVSNSTNKSENVTTSHREDLYMASEDLRTFDEDEEEEDDGGGRSYIT